MNLSSLVNVHRSGTTGPGANYFITIFKLFGIPVLTSKTDRKIRIVKLLGIPVYKGKVDRTTEIQQLRNQISMAIDPLHVPPAYGVLRIMQLSSFELLKSVDAICRKHELSYWLDFGTLLGAVRHKGFIPWDDDIDIGMLRSDWERLIDILKGEFIDGKLYFDLDQFLQIHYRGTTMQVDVFPYDVAPSSWSPDSDEEKAFVKRVYLAGSKIAYHSPARGVFVTKDHSYKQKRVLHQDIVMQGKPSAADGNVFLGFEISFAGRCKNSHRNEWFFPLKTIEFEGLSFPCPANPEMVLYSLYGDWGVLPSNPPVHFNRSSIGKDSLCLMLNVMKNGLKGVQKDEERLDGDGVAKVEITDKV